MNPKLALIGMWLGSWALVNPVPAAETNTVAGRVGVYDSRAVTYAWFVSDAQMAELKKQVAAAKAAQASGDDAKFHEYSASLKAKQDQIHRELFSTAPAAEALAALQAKLPEIERAAGVSALVSKWDEASLNLYPAAVKVDVTDELVRALCQPTDKQLKTIESIEKAAPVPLEKCNELIQKGEI